MIVSESILRNKSKEFAKQIVYMCRDIKANARESVLTNQLLRSGTSIGANIHEAQYAQGKKDFISKLEIAQKEYKPLQNQCGTIRRMLISSINTVKKNDK